MVLSHTSFTFENPKKGINGTVLVIGGSPMYTGAPYFCSLAALRAGSDLVYIFTDSSALIPLKTLLPEAIVLEFCNEKWILDRINVCVIGPGLGRPNSDHLSLIQSILGYLSKRGIFIIVDGDGIRLAEQLNLRASTKIIFTPNANEDKFVPVLSNNQFKLRKGNQDVIQTLIKMIIVDEAPCKKRVGGQGDILCGVLSTLIIKHKDIKTEEDVLLCLELASKIVRRAGRKAFTKQKWSLITRDVLEEICSSLLDVLDV